MRIVKKAGTAVLGLSGDAASFLKSGATPAPHRFLIFGQGRTGSTLLETLLDSHPEITCQGEILAWRRIFPEGFLDRSSRGHGTKAYGCHVKPHHHARLVQGINDLKGFAHRMHERGWLIVHLWRENTLEHVLSGHFARAAKSYRFTGDLKPPPLELTLDPERIIEKISIRQGFLEEERAALAGLPVHEIQYERDLKDPAGRKVSMAALQARLGVAPRNLQTPLKKSVQRSFSELVTNADDVLARLEASPFAHFAKAVR
ncbi:sulfotransferase [Parvularcula lutaonensis]|uniref:Sulfotransferase n=1 Tax=Parvularcula lutaonensis TaxID=491923 RepID=A0ABV7M956_9PROT|nr:sulfotransferase [Parvularcula lutaonensis]GGY46358.1 hypothetical protein GCM10007148_14330 [Parvularcula lutaonensis]